MVTAAAHDSGARHMLPVTEYVPSWAGWRGRQHNMCVHFGVSASLLFVAQALRDYFDDSRVMAESLLASLE